MRVPAVPDRDPRLAARAHREATRRLLNDHAAYAAAEFAQRAAATLEAGFVTLQHFPTRMLESRPATTPLPSAAAFRDTTRSQDYWCQCFDAVERFVVLDLNGGTLEVAGPALDAAQAAWVRREVAAHAAWLAQNPREAQVNAFAQVEGRQQTNSYQLRIQQVTVRVHGSGPAAEALLFTVVFDDRDRPRAAYGLMAPPTSFATTIFQRVIDRNPLLPASVSRGAPNDSLLRVVVSGPGDAEIYRSAADSSAAARASEPLPGAFGWLTTRVELRPEAAARLVEGGVPASPLPLLVGLLAVTAGVVGLAFLQLRRQHELARLRADFVSGVSHELRTPLTQIRMFSELLLGGRLRTDAERDRSLRLIDREARRLAFLVENVLDFSRAERGTLAHPAMLRRALSCGIRAATGTRIVYRNGVPVRLGDVARVSVGAENDYTQAQQNGEPGIALIIRRQPGSPADDRPAGARCRKVKATPPLPAKDEHHRQARLALPAARPAAVEIRPLRPGEAAGRGRGRGHGGRLLRGRPRSRLARHGGAGDGVRGRVRDRDSR